MTVFAAVSLSNVLDELGDEFHRQRDISALFNYGGSTSLAQQVERGAPADVFISAGGAPMDRLGEKGLLEPQTKTSLLTNAMVLVTSSKNNLALASLEELASPEVKRVAIADPLLAPAGEYARESLANLGLWEGLGDKLVMGADVRVTLAYVGARNADVGVVYETDALATDGIRVLLKLPQDSYSTIVYPAAILGRSERKVEAGEFLAFLESDSAREVFRRHGFQPQDR